MISESAEHPFTRRAADSTDSVPSTSDRLHRSDNSGLRRQNSKSLDYSQSRREGRNRSKTPSKSPPIKIWDPIQAEQDKVFRKKEREDLYHSQHPTEEPILLIKKREIITKYINPEDDIEDHNSSQIIKRSDKSKYVNVDYETAKRKMEELNQKE